LALAFVASLFRNAPDAVFQHITQVLYPPDTVYGGSVPEDYDPATSKSLVVNGYDSPLGRQALISSDSIITCLIHHVNNAFKGRTYSYLFSTPPGLHGQELYYVFYNEQSTDVFFRPINVTLAHIMQDYWLNFAQFGDPNGEGLPHFAKWGDDKSVQGLSLADVGPTQDDTDNERCRWWQLSLYV
jgi:carboxylesterase type B